MREGKERVNVRSKAALAGNPAFNILTTTDDIQKHGRDTRNENRAPSRDAKKGRELGVAKLVLFGAKDLARLAHFYFTHDSPHEVVAFCVEEAYRTAPEFLGLPLVGFGEVERYYPPEEHQMFIAVGYARLNQFRAEKYTEAKARGYTFVSYVSSRATVLTRAPIGENCFILEDCTIQPFSTIGHNVTLWSGSHVGHDSIIEDHCFLAPHAVVAGHCTVGAYSFLGVNATLRNAIHVASHSLIGPGAVILRDTVEYGVYLAPPAKRTPQRCSEVDL